MRRVLGAMVALGLLTAPAGAACRMALAIALDVSSSVDAEEHRLQIDGLADALLSPDVAAKLLELPETPVRLMVYEWSALSHQVVVLPWTDVTDQPTLLAIAGQLRATGTPLGHGATGLGQAMRFGARELARQTDCWQLKLDIAGDGENNTGPPPAVVAQDPEMARVTINALAVGSSSRTTTEPQLNEIKQLMAYFETQVIRGPDAFVEAALSYTDFAEAMRRKLLRELTALPLGALDPVIPAADRDG